VVLAAVLLSDKIGMTRAEEDDIPVSLYDIVEKDNKGDDLKMESLKGKVLFIVNTASRCPYTKEHYSLFRRLFKYRRHGLEIILAPSNQFMQEPGDDKAIMVFAKKQLFSGIILTKADVNGKTTRPLFKYLKDVTGKKFIEWYGRHISDC
jgi:glutathione peroxidase